MLFRRFDLCLREPGHHEHFGSRLLFHDALCKFDPIQAVPQAYIGEQHINVDNISADLKSFSPVASGEHDEVFPFQ